MSDPVNSQQDVATGKPLSPRVSRGVPVLFILLCLGAGNFVGWKYFGQKAVPKKVSQGIVCRTVADIPYAGPLWIPKYPGAVLSSRPNTDENDETYTPDPTKEKVRSKFITHDLQATVVKFFENAFTASGIPFTKTSDTYGVYFDVSNGNQGSAKIQVYPPDGKDTDTFVEIKSEP